MEENPNVGTTPNQKVEEKTFTQNDVNNLIARESKSAVEKLLKELGVEDIKSAKDGLNKFKEIQEAQKSDYDKMKESYEKIKAENETFKLEKADYQTNEAVKEVLNQLNIDNKYSKTVKKLMDFSGVEKRDIETLKPLVEKVIEEELPMLRNNENKKIGIEKESTKLDLKNNSYLEAFKKMRK